MDPFAITSDPAAYLPREATENALQRLEQGLREGRRVQVLSGPAGVGKTLLLHVLAARLGRDFRSLYLPYASLGWQDLCAWILGLLGEPAGAFPDRELLASARRSALHGRPLLLMVDEASAIPPESAESLAELVGEADGALRLLLVPVDDVRAGRVLATLARDVEELRLSAPLTLDETERYVRTRLVRSGVEFSLQRRFDADTIAYLHRVSGGNPRRLHHLAAEVLRGNLAVLPGSEALEALGAVPTSGDALEVDATEAEAAAAAREGYEEDLATEPALRIVPPRPAAGAGLAAAAAPRAAAAPAVAEPEPRATSLPARSSERKPERAPEPPLGPPEPEPTNWWIVMAVNLAIALGLVAGLWYGGLLPPPASH